MPNNMPGSGRYVRFNMASPTALIGMTPTWKGQSMAQPIAVPLIPGVSFEAQGRGVFSLSTPGFSGPRISGRRGTIDMWLATGVAGSVQTVAYLTDDLVHPSNYLAVELDILNRPWLDLQQIETPLTAATGTLTATGLVDTETVTIDGKTYTIQDILVEADGNVLKGLTVSDTLNNLVAAINLGRAAGVDYARATTLHPTVTAARGVGDSMVVTSKVLGAVSNAITTVAAALNASWGGATLTGGAGTTMTVARVTPSYAAIAEATPVHVRLTWDSEHPVLGTRHASLTVNGEAIPIVDWTTDPVASWASFQPLYLVLGVPLVGTHAFNGTFKSVQLSESVTP